MTPTIAPRSVRLPVTVALILAACAPLLAHDRKHAGTFVVTIGWSDEPAYTGSKNGIDVHVADAGGAPFRALTGTLSVEISFGNERMVLPLAPIAGNPGAFRAWIVPTRAGTYAFHVTGKLLDQPIDVTSTCSDTTFDCVVDAGGIQFPAKDPSTGQLADGLTRALPRTERAMATANRAQTVGVVAVTLAVVSLALSAALALRKERTDR